MAADDFFESEVALAAAATAAVLSPRVRGAIRQGVVYGVAGATAAVRTVAGAAESLGRGVADALPIGNGSANGRASTTSTPGRAATPRAASGTRAGAAAPARAARRPAAKRAKPTPAASPAGSGPRSAAAPGS